MKTEYVWTGDDLRLMGVHYPGKDTCVLQVHGMGRSFAEDYFSSVLGQKLSAEGYGFLYGHNRGYNHVNDVVTRPIQAEDNGYGYIRVGATYEVFEDCIKDVKAWVTKAQELGYKKIILLGHSLGCNKIIYYLHKNFSAEIAGVILASPPDMVGLVELEKYQPNHKYLLQKANQLVKAGKPRQRLEDKIWDWYDLSAQTYISLFTEAGAADNLPVLRNPEQFDQLVSIKQPILAIMGEHDTIEIKSFEEDLQLIKSKATNCSDFQIEFVKGGNHYYQNRENEFSEMILKWIGRTI